MVYQYYVVEIQQYNDGSYGHIVNYAFDEDADKARLKGEAKFHEVLAAAAVSELQTHSAIMFTTEGFPVMHQCYKHKVTSEPEAEPVEPETPAEEPETESSSLFS